LKDRIIVNGKIRFIYQFKDELCLLFGFYPRVTTLRTYCLNGICDFRVGKAEDNCEKCASAPMSSDAGNCYFMALFQSVKAFLHEAEVSHLVKGFLPVIDRKEEMGIFHSQGWHFEIESIKSFWDIAPIQPDIKSFIMLGVICTRKAIEGCTK